MKIQVILKLPDGQVKRYTRKIYRLKKINAFGFRGVLYALPRACPEVEFDAVLGQKRVYGYYSDQSGWRVPLKRLNDALVSRRIFETIQAYTASTTQESHLWWDCETSGTSTTFSTDWIVSAINASSNLDAGYYATADPGVRLV